MLAGCDEEAEVKEEDLEAAERYARVKDGMWSRLAGSVCVYECVWSVESCGVRWERWSQKWREGGWPLESRGLEGSNVTGKKWLAGVTVLMPKTVAAPSHLLRELAQAQASRRTTRAVQKLFRMAKRKETTRRKKMIKEDYSLPREQGGLW